jgi:hypothetical protein
MKGRPRESALISLTHCDGIPNLDGLLTLSVLARPGKTERPSTEEIAAARENPEKRFVSDNVIRLDPGLLTRLQKIVDRWPGRVIQITSGYRPRTRRTSRHRHGRALDLSLEGVDRKEMADFARTFDQTGVGYYPNSSHVHIDVRKKSYHWIDRSGPGQRPDYVAWPTEPANPTEATPAAAAGAQEVANRSASIGPALLSAIRDLERAVAEDRECTRRQASAVGTNPNVEATSDAPKSDAPADTVTPPTKHELMALSQRALFVSDANRSPENGAFQPLPSRTVR